MSLDECLSRKEAPVAGSLWNADLPNQTKGPPAQPCRSDYGGSTNLAQDQNFLSLWAELEIVLEMRRAFLNRISLALFSNSFVPANSQEAIFFLSRIRCPHVLPFARQKRQNLNEIQSQTQWGCSSEYGGPPRFWNSLLCSLNNMHWYEKCKFL